ncbi:MAG: tryptophan 2,3-dioxygenase [Micromonosporaceae bacterium]|jgi:tryptophan 2,3-dioxygenase|nr:tryptophan 2,3-dioxygenase [Micromonosporaceae bacterium]
MEPRLDPGHRTAGTAYDDYVGTRVLHGLVRTRTAEPTEHAFLVVTQVMELYFGLICFEWRHAQQAIRGDDVPDALAALRRSVQHMTALNASWLSLRGLTPHRFTSFRGAFGEASGFQSYAYRHLEFLLGLKSAAMVRPHRRSGDVYDELVAALHAPSLYDDALALLDRRGYHVPREVLKRDLSAPYQPSEAVERAWLEVYRVEEPTGGELFQLAEVLVDIAEEFTDWRHRHLASVRRSLGAKPGTGGSSGLAWLERSLQRPVFPELFSARTHM